MNSTDGGGSGSLGGGGGEGRKRYSSSFGHRYKDSLGGASEVSAGSAERKEKEKESDKSGVRSSLRLPVMLFLTTTGHSESIILWHKSRRGGSICICQ